MASHSIHSLICDSVPLQWRSQSSGEGGDISLGRAPWRSGPLLKVIGPSEIHIPSLHIPEIGPSQDLLGPRNPEIGPSQANVRLFHTCHGPFEDCQNMFIAEL